MLMTFLRLNRLKNKEHKCLISHIHIEDAEEDVLLEGRDLRAFGDEGPTPVCCEQNM